ncbi:MAG TPA: DUF2891 domain-containing protein [Salinimicrobium sp.]|nr:DUF2891 domain-containing protein [Salinimicrobium sp.]
MKKIFIVSLLILTLYSCKKGDKEAVEEIIPIEEPVFEAPKLTLTLEQANKLVELPLNCISQEYPNKLDQTLTNKGEIGEPKELHPAFYGCFDWHSSVHAHWSLVNLLRNFPDLKKAEQIKEQLQKSLSKENISGEVAYFNRSSSKLFERTYGWSWYLKLAEELHKWEDPLARELEENLQPLTLLIVKKTSEFLPKLKFPVRTGEHANTAFALVFIYDFAESTENVELMDLVKNRANTYYLKDKDCPVEYEPSGFDFLSPCFEEIDIMRRVLPQTAFDLWIKDFFPEIKNVDFSMPSTEVSERKDGKLVHLEGVNFSRAWVLYGLANQYPEQYEHLKAPANNLISGSLEQITKDTYEASHWLGSFAIYALNQTKPNLAE